MLGTETNLKSSSVTPEGSGYGLISDRGVRRETGDERTYHQKNIHQGQVCKVDLLLDSRHETGNVGESLIC